MDYSNLTLEELLELKEVNQSAIKNCDPANQLFMVLIYNLNIIEDLIKEKTTGGK